MKLYIKHMVSGRCKMAVKAGLDKLGLQYGAINLGEVEITGALTYEAHLLLKDTLQQSGLELIENKKTVLIEKIKTTIIEMVHYADEQPRINFSVYLSQKLKYNYTYLANLFSEVTGTTIEHFIIAHKIELVKELLLYNELNLTQISYKLNYSSVGHLSNQFKKVTGLTPTFYKQLGHGRHTTLENIGIV